MLMKVKQRSHREAPEEDIDGRFLFSWWCCVGCVDGDCDCFVLPLSSCAAGVTPPTAGTKRDSSSTTTGIFMKVLPIPLSQFVVFTASLFSRKYEGSFYIHFT
ncbi:hypothetical protein E2C01_025292 [Portunus trituberculatus]|uniref:Uncharacterized protein n=1 Tax=Portunus trituberculatus TaxID=210409 RepID=A0A5B7ECK3_PORTR|nr:hypothetical protein [Portunus trituberculatus]